MSTDDTPTQGAKETLQDANRRKLNYLEERIEDQQREINRLQSNIKLLESELGGQVPQHPEESQ